MWASDRAVQFYARAELQNRFCAHRFGDLEFVSFEFARCIMASVRRTVNRIDELERNGFEKKQATVLAMAIDETVEDRLKGVVEHFDSRLDGIDSQFKGINAQLSSQKYQIALITVTFGAALLGIFGAAYEYVLKPMIG